jgi:glucosamine--fructose-6-phosphate aminotransferase (isomerizing)
MATEIADQPSVLDGILTRSPNEIAEIVARIKAAAPRFVILAARGTSDHAALYAKYLLEIRLGLPCGLASPSTMTTYGARPDLRGVLFISVSQSGGSPDLVESMTTARACGALTLAVTNAPQSPLAAAAELHLDVHAGPERAVAATKSYTAELLSLYLLVDALAGGDGAAARSLPHAVATTLVHAGSIGQIAKAHANTDRVVVTGRGYSYPTARETALKLMETSYIAASAFSGADLLHGPLAMVTSGSAVITIVPDGKGGKAMQPVLERLREVSADLIVIGSAANVDGHSGIVLPAGLHEEVSPIVEIVPLQVLARELAVARGFDPDRPRGLKKVTETW